MRGLLRAPRHARPSLRQGSQPLRPSVRSLTAKAQAEPFTITTPLFYANADVIARYHRMRGARVRFVTGTDEHGEKIAESAAKAGVSPQSHCDGIVARYKELWQKMDISYDAFVRTTDVKHEAVVKALLESVWDAGDIYKASYSGRYCVGCEEFKDDEDLDADGNCLIHRTPCPVREEENYFFKLTAHEEAVQRFVASDAVQPARAANEVKAWVADGCRDFSITRAEVEWGIRVPRDTSQTIYVWFDALIGYLSALLPEGQEVSAAALQEHGWPAGVHIIGRDILRFHAVFWPGMLQSMGLPLPGKVFGHGFLTKDGLKMGKSLGNVLNPFQLVDAYGADAVRLFFMKEIPFGQDGDFSERRFQDLVNAALANNIGNLLNRSLNLLKKNCDSQMPCGAASTPEDHPVRQAAAAAAPAASTAYQGLAIHDAVEAAISISNRANLLLEETQPWTALKKGSEEEKAAAGATLVTALEGARIAAVLLAPVTPGVSRRVYEQLGLAGELEDSSWECEVQWGRLEQGHAFPKPKPVFQRLEGDLILEPAQVAVAA